MMLKFMKLDFRSFSVRYLMDKTKMCHQQSLCFSDSSKNSSEKLHQKTNNSKLTPNVETKYEAFTEDNTAIVLDIEEERDRMLNSAGKDSKIILKKSEAFLDLSTEREC